jgi:uncharacterized protein (DUF608 family)
MRHSHWPILTSYDQDHLTRIAMPIGGIGTGTVSLGGRGQLLDWEIQNRPNKGGTGAENYGLRDYGASSLFVLYAKSADGEPVLRALEGALEPPYEGSHGSVAGFHGVPRFRECEFHAAYPLGQVTLNDPTVPLSVRLEAFNPLIPGDADRSGIPMACLRYVLNNSSDQDIEATVCGTLANLTAGKTKRNSFREQDGLCGLIFSGTDGDELAREWGTMALTTNAEDVTYKAIWPQESWRRSLLHFWDDLSADGRLDDGGQAEAEGAPYGSLAASVTVPAGGSAEVTFCLSWHFPNRYNWSPGTVDCECGTKKLNPADRIGNYYTQQYGDAWDVAARELPHLAELERETVAFVEAICDSDLPAEIKESALYNASTLRTETCFRTPDGLFYGWEGCCDGGGCCSGSCTHVWNYETTTPFLFGDLARRMREVEFLHCTNPENGQMSFRVALPIEREKGQGAAAADGQMGCIMKAYREWKLCGDNAWLAKLWPRVRKALEFAWIPGGWDADQDGVMEGCQHNTMDVEYYGPNPQMGSWYLGALRAAEEMATAMGDSDFAATCRKLFENGSAWLDEHLFNGEYYEHEIRPPAKPEDVAPSLKLSMGAKDVTKPDLQLGPGCLVDQLVGQYLAHVCGLGYLLDRDHVERTLAAIKQHNFRDDLYSHFNNMRSYALNDESALLMASYPRGGRPESPFPYFNEVMTGFEYCAGTHMLYEGMIEDGLTVIRAIRARYNGRRRSPFNEAECGHHYARAMAAWTGILAWTGFQYDATSATMTVTRPGCWFWSTGDAWGTVEVTLGGAKVQVQGGEIRLSRFLAGGLGEGALEEPAQLTAGDSQPIGLRR